MTEISEKAQKTIDEWVEKYPNAWKHNICALACVDRNTGKITQSGTAGYQCHAPIMYIKGPDVVVNAHRADWQKLNPEYMKWVAQGSPFSHGVLNRDDLKQIFNHASVIDTEIVGKGGVLWVCKAFRYFVEDTWKPGVWDKLREQGLTGLQAFIGASILDAEGRPMNNSHVNLVGYKSPADLRKVYDKWLKIKKHDSYNVREATYEAVNAKEWGSLAGKIKKIPDGWGGFTEKREMTNAKDYAGLLKEIFEGDPKNVG